MSGGLNPTLPGPPRDGLLCRLMSGRRGQLGASTNLSKSPKRQARDRRRRKREEARWAGKSGPVATRFVYPICGLDHSRADHPAD